VQKISDERKDNMLGGFAIILLGILLCGSAIWGLVDDVYSMNGGLAPALVILLGVGSIIMGVAIYMHKPEAESSAVRNSTV
jgi:hypothetical protein